MWTESNTPSKIEGAGGADVPKALIYRNAIRETLFPELVFIRPESVPSGTSRYPVKSNEKAVNSIYL